MAEKIRDIFRDLLTSPRRAAELQDEVHDLKYGHKRQTERLEQQIAYAKSELQAAKITIQENVASRSELEESLNRMRSELEATKLKLARVSQEDWARIEDREKAAQEKAHKAKKANRITVRCTCHNFVGDVREGCRRCGGRGEYVVDGYGHIVG